MEWVTFQGATLKTMSRHQQLVSLSSMEADLHALQSAAQEVKSIGKVVGWDLRCIKEVGDSDFPEDFNSCNSIYGFRVFFEIVEKHGRSSEVSASRN